MIHFGGTVTLALKGFSEYTLSCKQTVKKYHIENVALENVFCDHASYEY